MIDFHQHTGFPKKKGHPHYGLYQPLIDCFLLITDDKNQSLKIKNLCSSKFILYVCQLDLAENYDYNMIDNSCCEKWTMTTDTSLDFTSVSRTEIITPTLLMQSSKTNVDIDFKTEKEWLQYVWYWTRIIERFPYDAIPWYDQKKLVLELTDLKFPESEISLNKIHVFLTTIKKFLFFSKNIEQCHTQIIDYLNKNPNMACFLSNFKSS